MHDVRMVKLADNLNLAIEPADDLGFGKQLLANHLEGDHSVQLLVPSLEDLAGRPFAKTLQDDVRTQDELADLAEKEMIDLVGSQPAAIYQFFGQEARVGKSSGQIPSKLVELGRVDNLKAPEDCHQVGHRGNGLGLNCSNLGQRRPFWCNVVRRRWVFGRGLGNQLGINSLEGLAQLGAVMRESGNILLVIRPIAPARPRPILLTY